MKGAARLDLGGEDRAEAVGQPARRLALGGHGRLAKALGQQADERPIAAGYLFVIGLPGSRPTP